MKKDTNIQSRVADELLQTPETFYFGGVRYSVPPPTFGTLTRVSGMLARIPSEGITAEEGKEFGAIISSAYKYGVVPRIVALLILGAKEAAEPAQKSRGGFPLFRLFRRKKDAVIAGKTKLDALTERLDLEASPGELKDAIVPLLERLELKDFFVLTTFLHRLNVTKPTKVEEATAPGR